MKMKNFFSHTAAASLALLACIASAQAATISVKPGESVALPSCQGTLDVSVTVDNRLKLVFHDVVNCSNFDIYSANGTKVDHPNVKLGGYNRSRGGAFILPKSLMQPGKNEITVLLKSNSGRTGDRIRVKFSVFSADYITLNQKKTLTECNGTIEVKTSWDGTQDQVNLVFKNIEFCSNFDILSANGQALDYPNKKLTVGRDGLRSGSFTLPKEVIREGLNKIVVSVQSNSGAHRDNIAIKFEQESLPFWFLLWLLTQ